MLLGKLLSLKKQRNHMTTLLIAVLAMVAYLVAYNTYGKWLSKKIFRLDPSAKVPSIELNDDRDYVPTDKSVLFGHHFTSIAGTGPIVGPAIAVMWGWLPALIWVLLGSILVGAVHDFGSLVVSMRSQGQTVGDVAGRVLNRRVRLLFLIILFMALTIVLAIFGLVIATVFRIYPASIFPCLVQIPIAMVIGAWLHRKNVNLLVPSIIALVTMYLTLIYGNVGLLGQLNAAMAGWSLITWVIVLLVYSYVASVMPVWMLLQPRDYINSLQLITALGLVVIGLLVAGLVGGAAIEDGASRVPLELAAPMIRWEKTDAPAIFPFLFITIACGACSGFHCLVSSGTSSKQIKSEADAQFVGYGSMLTEGFLATVVILACAAGLGLGVTSTTTLLVTEATEAQRQIGTVDGTTLTISETITGKAAYDARYSSWAGLGLPAKLSAFVDGSANFLRAIGLPAGIAVAIMGVLVASFAGTTLDTACRLQRYVIQELAFTFTHSTDSAGNQVSGSSLNPLVWLTNKHGATIFAVVLAVLIAALPNPKTPVAFSDAVGGTLSADYLSTATDVTDEIKAGGIAGATWWIEKYAGGGGLILWPLFGATNQLLAGLAFLVISFFLWRRGIPVWFIVIPMIFMLCVPAWAMLSTLPGWIDPNPDVKGEPRNWVVIFVGIATLVLEVWMIVEAFILWPKVKGIVEELPSLPATASTSGPNC